MTGATSFAEIMESLRAILQQVPGLAALTAAPYLFRPFVMLLALSVAAGVVGTVINLRRAEFTAETMSHSVFPGVVLGFICVGLEGIIPGGAIAGILTACVLTLISRRAGGVDEAGSAVVLAAFYAVGIVISLAHSDKSGQLEALMFGRLLEISWQRLEHGIWACAIAAAVVAVSWRRHISVAFDRDVARAEGIQVTRIDAAFNFAVAAAVVAGASAVGVLLVVGYLMIPAACARLLASSAVPMAATASAIAIAASYLGMLFVAYPHAHRVSPQACVDMTLLGTYILIAATKGVMIKWARLQRGGISIN